MHNIIPFPALSAAGAQGRFAPKVYVHSLIDFVELDSRSSEDETVAPWPVDSIANFYAHVLMAGEQAIAACDEFSELLETRGEHAAAALLRELAIVETERAHKLAPRTAGLPMPQLPRWQYHWLYNAPPDQAMQELVFHLLTPHAALGIAMDAESRSMVLYERISCTAVDSEVQAQARELAAEKSRHVRWLSEALASVPAPLAWQEDFNGLVPAQ